MAVLQGVRAYLVFQSEGPVNSKAVVSRTLERLGAKVCKRLSKDVTHIILQKLQAATQEKLAQDQETKAVYDAAASYVRHCRSDKQVLGKQTFTYLLSPTGQ